MAKREGLKRDGGGIGKEVRKKVQRPIARIIGAPDIRHDA